MPIQQRDPKTQDPFGAFLHRPTKITSVISEKESKKVGSQKTRISTLIRTEKKQDNIALEKPFSKNEIINKCGIQ